MRLDHNLIMTTNLGACDTFLVDIVGLERGERPPFPFPGAWYYSEGKAIAHVAESQRVKAGAGPIDHLALSGANYDDLMQRVRSNNVRFHETDVPLSGERQIFIEGPDGLVIEMTFPLGTGPSLS